MGKLRRIARSQDASIDQTKPNQASAVGRHRGRDIRQAQRSVLPLPPSSFTSLSLRRDFFVQSREKSVPCALDRGTDASVVDISQGCDPRSSTDSSLDSNCNRQGGGRYNGNSFCQSTNGLRGVVYLRDVPKKVECLTDGTLVRSNLTEIVGSPSEVITPYYVREFGADAAPAFGVVYDHNDNGYTGYGTDLGASYRDNCLCEVKERACKELAKRYQASQAQASQAQTSFPVLTPTPTPIHTSTLPSSSHAMTTVVCPSVSPTHRTVQVATLGTLGISVIVGLAVVSTIALAYMLYRGVLNLGRKIVGARAPVEKPYSTLDRSTLSSSLARVESFRLARSDSVSRGSVRNMALPPPPIVEEVDSQISPTYDQAPAPKEEYIQMSIGARAQPSARTEEIYNTPRRMANKRPELLPPNSSYENMQNGWYVTRASTGRVRYLSEASSSSAQANSQESPL